MGQKLFQVKKVLCAYIHQNKAHTEKDTPEDREGTKILISSEGPDLYKVFLVTSDRSSPSDFELVA